MSEDDEALYRVRGALSRLARQLADEPDTKDLHARVLMRTGRDLSDRQTLALKALLSAREDEAQFIDVFATMLNSILYVPKEPQT